MDLSKEDEAKKIWAKVFIDIDPLHPESTFNYSLLQWRAAEIDDLEVIRRVEGVVKSHPDKWPSLYYLGLVHMERGDLQNALTSLNGVETRQEIDEARKRIQELWPGVSHIRILQGHRGSVNCVAFSPDGHLLISGSGDNTLRLWDVETGTCLRSFKGHQLGVNSAAFSPDGQFILSGSDGFEHDDMLRLWDVKTGGCLRILKGHRKFIYAVAISSDGQYALSGSADNTMRLWDLNTGVCLNVFDDHEGEVIFVAFNADSSHVYSGSNDHILRVWDIETSECLNIHFAQDTVTSFTYSPISDSILSGSEESDIMLWEAESGNCVRAYDCDGDEAIKSIAISPDERYIVSGGANPGLLRIWNAKTRRCLRTISDYDEDINSIAFSPDGCTFATGSGSGYEQENDIKVWNAKGIEQYHAPFALTLPSSGAEKVAQEQVFFEYINQARQALLLENYSRVVKLIQQTRSLSGYERHEALLEINEALYPFCKKTRLLGGWNEETFYGHWDTVKSITISHDGYYALSGSLDKEVRLYDLQSKDLIRVLGKHKNGVTSVAFHPKENVAISGSQDGTVMIWDLDSPESTIIQVGEAVNSISVHPDGRTFFCDQGMTVRQWDFKSKTCVRSFNHQSYLSSFACSPDGRFVITGGQDNLLKLWAIDTGECLRSYSGHTGRVSAVAISPDGGCILSGSSDKTLRKWRIQNSDCIQILKADFFVDAVAFSMDGRFAISASGPVQIWDIETGECVYRFTEHENRIETVAFSPNGRYALSGSRDRSIKLWALDWELQDYPPAEWDEEARPYLEVFLSLHTPFAPEGLVYLGNQIWTEQEFQELLSILRCAGLGWLRPEGVRKKLIELAAQRR